MIAGLFPAPPFTVFGAPHLPCAIVGPFACGANYLAAGGSSAKYPHQEPKGHFGRGLVRCIDLFCAINDRRRYF